MTLALLLPAGVASAQAKGGPATPGPSGPSVVRNKSALPGPSGPSTRARAKRSSKPAKRRKSAYALGSFARRGSPGLRVAQGGHEMRIVSVADLVRAYGRDSLPTYGWALRARNQESDDQEFMPSPGGRPADIDVLINQIRSHIEPDSWDASGSRIFTSHARLIFVNKPGIVAKAAQRIEDHRRLIAPRVRVSTVVVAVTDESKLEIFGRVGGSDARELYESAMRGSYGKVLSSGSTECRAGELVFLGSRRTKSLLSDFDVEVAQDSKIADPITNKIDLANGVGVLPVVLPNAKGFAVFCQVASSDLESLVNKAVGTGPIRHVEQASVATMQGLYNFSIEGDGGVFFAPSAGRRALVVIERLDEQPSADYVKRCVPVSLLSTSALASIQLSIDQRDHIEEEQEPEILSIDEIISIGRDASGSDDLDVSASETAILMKGKSDEMEIAKNAMHLLLSTMTKSYVVELRRESRPIGSGGAWKPFGRPLVLSALGQRSSSVRVGTERHVLRDYNVEIAQEAAVADPIVDRIFDGQLVTASVSTLDAQRCAIRISLTDNSIAEMRDLPPAATDSGTMTLPDQRRATLRRRIVATSGRNVHIGSGAPRSVDGTLHATRWVLRLR